MECFAKTYAIIGGIKTMATSRKKIGSKKPALTHEEKKQKHNAEFEEWTKEDYANNLWIAENGFIVSRINRHLAKASMDDYRRFIKKLNAFLRSALAKTLEEGTTEEEMLRSIPAKFIMGEATQILFKQSLGNVNIQTINHYMRSYKAFGHYCEDEGMFEGFECPIHDEIPPAKETYTKQELAMLINNKPTIDKFTEFRNYCVIMVLLSTGGRTKSILDTNICDVDLEEGYITYQHTKTHKVARIGLEKSCVAALRQFIQHYRTTDYEYHPIDRKEPLFCNQYGERMTRSGLYKAVTSYAQSRGVSRTGLHLFRHTFAKEWLMSGGDGVSLQKVLTHSTMEMVNRYANLYDTDVKEKIVVHSALSQVQKQGGKSLNTKFKKK